MNTQELEAFLSDVAEVFYEFAEADDEVINAFIDLALKEYDKLS